jgi:hypothetical protein
LNCGETLPLQKSFGFTAWATPPAQIDADEGTELAHKNEQNIEIEEFNSKSIRQTLRYKHMLVSLGSGNVGPHSTPTPSESP